ncbi:Myb-like DNA-binding domain containing protein [Trichomonas vaginalis G3]|uniref:Myb-like DNA-binding domain containing protein n=1 Tax=Trichomonas vaginalis (strain ATCC PRA-98 / G3) TaxID=412133 RepID=A2FXK3_TRIV3|nr:RNA polymerase II transcription regulator recruiting protein [Trichomonas vaginalis G3]EAX90370.1 Myb-like DNA-binding domain containing protein [Trichomonas vaginalis G3]KAI5509702.1 RNA polymerase II transcription regulator recruiting protein [Trichomonas vaginalis G3]|eukprot:XP_001303300.1 Myb-like DNA-binding domain containing protein [Trichomonas vaginalis G3]
MLVQNCGKRINWQTISFDMEGRTPRQCRERYTNYLAPNIERSDFSPQEDKIILSQYEILGSKWRKMSEFLPGRTANSIRNRYFHLIKKQTSGHNRIESSTDNEVDVTSEVASPLLFNITPSIFDIPTDSIFFENVLSSNTF